jgi:predicted MFS family arabinose efflux permease
MFGLQRGPSTWVLYIIGGIIGVILVGYLFDWALITLSSLAGASLIVESFTARQGLASLIFFVLFIAGVLIQGTAMRSEKQSPRSASSD